MEISIYIYIPRTQMTSVFEGTQPPKRRPKLQSKQGAPFRFQVYIDPERVLVATSHMPAPCRCFEVEDGFATKSAKVERK